MERFRMIMKLGGWIPVLALWTAAAAAAGEPPRPEVAFEDRTDAAAGFVHRAGGGDSVSGVAFLDYNGDGWLDLYVANGVGHDDGLLRNDGPGDDGRVSFTNVAAEAGLGDGNGSSGVAAADLDNDGDTDLIVLGDAAFLFGTPSVRSIRLYANDGAGRFTDVTADSGLEIPQRPGAALQAVLGDVDGDGFLDVFVVAPASLTDLESPRPGNHLFRNLGGLRFDDVSAGSGVDYAGAACAAAFSHYNRDGLIDLFVADCNVADPPGDIPGIPTFRATPLRLYRNRGDGTFVRLDVGLPDPPAEQPLPPTDRGFWMCVGLGDIDNDRDLDLFSTNVGTFFESPAFEGIPQAHTLQERIPGGRFRAIEAEAGIADAARHFSWGCSFADFNNDGLDDLAFAGNLPQLGEVGNPGYVFVNQGGRRFRSADLPVDLGTEYSSGVATGDWDNDGRVDLVISNAGFNVGALGTGEARPTLLRNLGDGGNHSITIRLVGSPPSNRDAVGAEVRLVSGGLRMVKEVRAGSSFLSQDSPWLTFGLGQRRWARAIRVQWPSGRVERYHSVRGGRTITIVEGQGIVGE